MKRLLCSVGSVAVLFVSPLAAQDNEAFGPRVAEDYFLPENTQSAPAADWQRYATPQQLIHRRAAMKAAQRQARIEAMNWFGFSPARPPATTVPFMGSPTVRPTPMLVDSPWMVFTHRPDMGY